jgi:DNA N-6-adenine-methyltransferase (Dam)
MMRASRRTIDASERPAVVGGMKARNNGRYNGNGREWATPPEVFEPLHAEYRFTLDVCATPASAKVPRFFTEADNGLERSWAGERAWMNPPYGREIYAWTRKARLEVGGGIACSSWGCCRPRRTSHGGTKTSSAMRRSCAGTADASAFSPADPTVRRASFRASPSHGARAPRGVEHERHG